MFLADYTGFHGVSLAALVGAWAAAAAWAVLLVWRWFATFPYLPDAGPPTSHLGDEPAAIANLLVHRWHASRSAVAATVLDLAARGLLAVEQYGERVVIRVYRERRSDASLAPYEALLLDHIARTASARSAPVAALEFDDPAEADSFWRRFRREVEQDARARGLARSRWTTFDETVIGGALAAALALAAIALSTAHVGATGGDEPIGPIEWAVGALIAWVAINGFVFTRRTLRDTSAGRTVCSRWLGVRDHLREAGTFGDLPASAVTVCGRNLACGVALGVSHRAAAELPFGAEDPETAWSRATGEWRELEVRYPTRLGACRAPAAVLVSGLGQALLFGFLLFIAFRFVTEGAWAIGRDLTDVAETGAEGGRLPWLLAILAGILAVGAAVLLVLFLIGLALVYRGLADLTGARVIAGEVVKAYGGRVALDEGKGANYVVAWVPPVGSPALQPGMRARVTKTPRLHWVSKVELATARA